MATWLGLSQTEVRSLELRPVSQVSYRVPSNYTMLPCVPRPTTECQIGSGASKIQTGTPMLVPLCHSAASLTFILDYPDGKLRSLILDLRLGCLAYQ